MFTHTHTLARLIYIITKIRKVYNAWLIIFFGCLRRDMIRLISEHYWFWNCCLILEFKRRQNQQLRIPWMIRCLLFCRLAGGRNSRLAMRTTLLTFALRTWTLGSTDVPLQSSTSSMTTRTYRVSNKSIYTFINACSSFMSSPIELKPIPVHFSANSPYISD
jgi:hypothetical protein